jgi:hypothetical protein
MATNKNQHFVPRCYLRPFTIDGADAAINIYNLDRKKFIPMAPVKSQCSGDYFYGQDKQLEHAIQLVESGYGHSLRTLLNSSKTLSDSDKSMLKTFWLFQHLRTEAAATRAVEMSESVRNIARIEGAEFRLGIKDAVMVAMKTFAESMRIIDDLKFCLVKNKTKRPFITSDDPAILTNKWHLEDNRTRGRSFGLRAAGALTILPLSPKLLFLGYDGDVYSIPHQQGIVETKSERDIIAYNQHQFLNCRANIFLKDAVHAEVVHSEYMEISTNRPKTRHVIHYAVRDKTEGDFIRYEVVDPKERVTHEEVLIHSQVIRPRPQFWPNQLRIRSTGSVYTNGTGLGFVRRTQAESYSRAPFHKERP